MIVRVRLIRHDSRPSVYGTRILNSYYYDIQPTSPPGLVVTPPSERSQTSTTPTPAV